MKGQEDDHAGKLLENRIAALKEMVFCLALKWTHNRADAEDIAQQAICLLIARVNRSELLGDIEDEQKYLCRIAQNLWNDELRRRRKERSISLNDDHKFEGAVKNPLLDDETTTKLREFKRRVSQKVVFVDLSDEEVELYTLNQIEGMKPKQIAKLKGGDVDSIRYQINKVSAKVRYRLRKIAGDRVLEVRNKK